MSSETITRNDLTNILNEVLPFSFTEFRNQSGTITVANSTLVQAHSETFTDGSWLILTTFKTLSGGSTTANAGQNRIIKDGNLVYAHKSLADTNIVNTNFYVLKNANNTTITLEAFQATGNSQSQEWTFSAIRIGDKFAEPSADYIVEQGTDGIWTYRKWNGGIAECWTYIEGNSASDGRWHINPTLPSFFSAEQVIVNVNYWSSGYTTTSAGYTRTNISGSTWSIDAYMYNGAPNAISGAYVSAKGRWK